MNRTAIYCRLSEEDAEKASPSDDSESIQNQKSLLISYALKQGWEISGIYCDDNYSGADANRPDFRRMLADAEAGRFDIILCKTQSRFTRDMEMVERYIHGSFQEWGIRFVTAVDHVDTNTKGGKKARQINGLINEWYLEDLSENVRAVLDDKRKRGKFIGSFAPYGYRKAAEDHNRLLVDEEAAEVVRRIFTMRLEGMGCVAIAKRLNEEGVLCPTDYKQAKGYPCKPLPDSASRHLWKDYTVREILSRDTYAGTLAQGLRQKVSYKSEVSRCIPRERRVLVPGAVEAIVTPRDFERAQALAAAYVRPASTAGEPHLLAGRVFCGLCGSPLHLCRAKGRAYLRCRASYRYGADCQTAGIRFEEVEQAVLAAVQEKFARWFDGEAAAGLLKEVRHGPSALEVCRRELSVCGQGLARIARAERMLYADKVSGEITGGQYEEFRKGYVGDRQALLEKQERLRARYNQLAGGEAEGLPLIRRMEAYRMPQKLDRELVGALIERVELRTRGQTHGSKEVVLTIGWQF